MARKKKIVKAEPAMRITVARKKVIHRLAAALAEIAPTTTIGSGFCVKRVAEEKGLKACWKKQKNKVADIAYLLENTLRKYPRKPKLLVLAIIEGGAVWMANRGKSITDEQKQTISDAMKELGFDIKKELKRIHYPPPSKVAEPSQDVSATFDRLDLHQNLKDDIREMFRDGHFNEAVRKALERFEKMVQDKIGDHKIYGRDLMAKAFNENKPMISLNAMTTANDRSEQEGFKFLTMGAMSGMRNLYSHGDVPQMSAPDAIERLCFVSLLMKRIDLA